MANELKTIKFQLMLSSSEAEAIDDWGFKNRIRTRAEAIRRLCQIGLIADARASDLARATKEHADLLADFMRQAAEIVEWAEGKSNRPDLAPIASGSVELVATLSRLTSVAREVSGQAHNLRDNAPIDDVLANVAEVSKVFERGHCRAAEKQRDASFGEIVAAAIERLDRVIDDVVHDIARALDEGHISATDKPAVHERIVKAQRHLTLLNAKIGEGA